MTGDVTPAMRAMVRWSALVLVGLVVLHATVEASDPLDADFGASLTAAGRSERSPRRSTVGMRQSSRRMATRDNQLRPSTNVVDVEPPSDQPAYRDRAVAHLAGRPDAGRRLTTASDEPATDDEGGDREFAPAFAQPPASAAVQPAVLTEDPTEAETATTAADQRQNSEPPAASGALPLAPRRSQAGARDRGTSPLATGLARGIGGTGLTIVASLALVLGLFFLFAWLLRRGMPGSIPALPKSVVEVLGRLPMPGRQQMQLIRCGNKLLLVHLSLAGAETLTEISEPAEVDRIAGLCLQHVANSATRDFHEVLSELGRDRPARLMEQDYGLELGGGRAGRQRARRDLDG